MSPSKETIPRAFQQDLIDLNNIPNNDLIDLNEIPENNLYDSLIRKNLREFRNAEGIKGSVTREVRQPLSDSLLDAELQPIQTPCGGWMAAAKSEHGKENKNEAAKSPVGDGKFASQHRAGGSSTGQGVYDGAGPSGRVHASSDEGVAATGNRFGNYSSTMKIKIS